MMSGTPEAVITNPMTVPRTPQMSSTATASARQAPRPWPSIHSAARQLANTIIEPTDRSMPPEMTTTAWAMARNASAIVPAVIVRISKSPKRGSCDTRHSSSTTNSRPTPIVHPRRWAKRDAADVGVGSVVVMPS